jgi:hypothetical protein
VTSGSAIYAPLPPLVGLLAGAWLASRRGRARTAGLVVLVLVCAAMTLGWVGEYASGIPFTGGATPPFLVISVLGIPLPIALAVQAVRGLLGRGNA